MLAQVAIVLSTFRIESALYLLSFTRMNEVLKANNNSARTDYFLAVSLPRARKYGLQKN